MKAFTPIALSGLTIVAIAVTQQNNRAATIERSFKPFAPAVTTRSDENFFYVESNGMPDHELMTGIVAWQQQVPLPQFYYGANAWRFPLNPNPADAPLSAKTGFFRGAIAIAANGVPIFNPIKNDGRTDTNLAGELDQFGGHAGRADDYHYHVAPLHLIEKLGLNTPIAYALDGYPIYGLTCSNGQQPTDLDPLNGHTTPDRGYHYHATKNYPYLNGGFHGVVTEQGGQVDPQPLTAGIRPALTPLRGAQITAYSRTSLNSYSLEYQLNNAKFKVNYTIQNDGSYLFEFINPDGTSRKETYAPSRLASQFKPTTGTTRKPWIMAHTQEMDTNKDMTVTLTEVLDLARAAFKEVAGTADEITLTDLKAHPPARNVIGGYLKQHADEFDIDRNGKVSLQEVLDTFTSLFHKADTNHDHAITEDEYAK